MSDPAASATRKAFDAIDGNNIAQAEVLVENGLKKFPQHHGLQAAEAFVLYRTGKRALALDRATTLALRDDLRDSTAIDALAHILQGLGGWDALTTLYQRAAQQLPDSLNAQENYFQALIRQGSYSEAQRVALGLNRKVGGKYQSWAIMAMLAQVPPDSKDHLLLKLSTRLIVAGALSTDGCKSYVDLLIQQEQYDEAFTFLKSTRGEKIGLLERRVEHVRVVLLALGRKRAAAAACRFLISLSADNWKYYAWYLDAVEAGDTAGDDEDEDITLEADPNAPLSSAMVGNLQQGQPTIVVPVRNVLDRRLEDVVPGLLEPLQQTESSDRPSKQRRAPFLAELEVLKRLIQKSEPEARCATERQLRTLLVSYCERFGTKPVCFMDIVPYLSIAGGPEAVQDVVRYCESARASEAATPATSAALYILQCKCSLVAPAGAPIADAEALDQVEALVRAYREALPISEGLGWSEEGACDGFLSCAVTLALRKHSGDSNVWLLRALEILRNSERTMNNPSWLMLAVQVQRHLGVVDTKMTKQLDFKSVQFDSMRHIGYTPLLDGGAISDQERWDSEAHKFYHSLGKETSSLRIKVFKFFTWPMWKDLIGFEGRLKMSIGRLETLAAFALSGMRSCQTQKDLFQHVEEMTKEVESALDVLQQQPGGLVSNEDSVVLRAAIVDDIHSERSQSLASRLLSPTRTMCQRTQEVHGRLALFSVVRDHITREVERQRKAAAPRNKKGNAGSVNAATTPAAVLLTQRQPTAEIAWPSPLAHIVPLLLQALFPNEAALPPTSPQWSSAIAATVADLVVPTIEDGDSIESLSRILMPTTGYVLQALMQGACTELVPVARLADAVKSQCIEGSWMKVLSAAGEDVNAGNSRLRGALEVSHQLHSNLVSLQRRKVRELQQLVADLNVCCTAASKRR